MFESVSIREVVWLSTATACISFAISETTVFFCIREMAKKISSPLGKITSCGYCLSHWVSIVLILTYLRGVSPYDIFPLWLVISWFASIQWATMCYWVKIIGK